ncbi:hypothetical protein J7I93_08700 [Bacillus sp. ISL-47]|uniref:hypothetical protein n=1 Tax=Bacillus sp. ISL-47 TaxID=2819130 RepID=UPI001BE9A32B|nr:hypothetical protein [Bacillus sp. ISL-47]MBT2688258.1 hypothetical protein [Bacillus sp. ISL-47]MBT2710051.1 hypothetical protein [Pseudomonas sp. ISL-84]
MAIKINVQKAYEEVDIAGKVYVMDLNDHKLQEYTKAFKQFRKESLNLSEKDFADMTEDEQTSAERKNLELMEKVADLLLGKGSFQKVYRDTGKSLMIMADILLQLMDVVNGRLETFKKREKAYYTGK